MRIAAIVFAGLVLALEVAITNFLSWPMILSSLLRLVVWAGLFLVVRDVAGSDPLRVRNRVLVYVGFILLVAIAGGFTELIAIVDGAETKWETFRASLAGSASAALLATLLALGARHGRALVRTLGRVWAIALLLHLPAAVKAAYSPRFDAAAFRASATPHRGYEQPPETSYRAGYMTESLISSHVLDGQSPEQVEHALGPPTRRYDHQFFYFYENTWTCADRFIVSFDQGKVSGVGSYPCD